MKRNVIIYLENYLLKKGANSGFHEAIGDTAALSVMNQNHFIKLGILKKEDQTASNIKSMKKLTKININTFI